MGGRPTIKWRLKREAKEKVEAENGWEAEKKLEAIKKVDAKNWCGGQHESIC